MKPTTLADIEGPWIESDFDSALIARCNRYWNSPIPEIPNGALATYLRQGLGSELVRNEARRRVDQGFRDGSEMFEGELAEVLQQSKNRTAS